ncbi:MAG: hypothetical protein JW798_03650 [Prolixibacteraceae bacterium]|nr:hypothetical protein [Prolixibacteraceae bacterium]
MKVVTTLLKKFIALALIISSGFSFINGYAQEKCKNFNVAIYARAYEVQKMKDPQWLESTWKTISSQLKIDKIYLETHRDLLIVDRETLENAISFFKSKGVKTSGGITYTIDESNQFQTFCYTNPGERAKAQEIIEYTASFFDEVILDDFFFTSCKCGLCVKAKGDKSWTEYRLELMKNAANDLILTPAKKVNPNVKVVIKYPNWYDHFHGLGFNLEAGPNQFDGVYTGTETRDAVFSNQHLQPYLSYLIFRYFNNLKPGENGGGWVDTGGMRFYDRYAEQLWLTMLAKAPEITLFDYRQMLYPLRPGWEPVWKNQDVSFDYSDFLPADTLASMATTASHSLNIIDKVVGKFGNPYGIKSYKPFHSQGEDFLQNYFGMIGIPVDLVPYFPMDDEMIILTEQAKHDPEIVEKIEQRLKNGKDVLITSGLLNALQNRGIRKIVDLEYTTRKSEVKDFLLGRRLVEGDVPMIIPQVQYQTNDSWEIISGMNNGLGWPLLHQGKFANATLYLLVIPENFSDLYNLPIEVLNQIRSTVMKDLPCTLEGPSNVSLFMYDNRTLVLHSFNDEPVEMKLVFQNLGKALSDILTGEVLESERREAVRFWGRTFSPEKNAFNVKLPPHSFRALIINEID